jgi:hypothetical protein
LRGDRPRIPPGGALSLRPCEVMLALDSTAVQRYEQKQAGAAKRYTPPRIGEADRPGRSSGSGCTPSIRGLGQAKRLWGGVRLALDQVHEAARTAQLRLM